MPHSSSTGHQARTKAGEQRSLVREGPKFKFSDGPRAWSGWVVFTSMVGESQHTLTSGNPQRRIQDIVVLFTCEREQTLLPKLFPQQCLILRISTLGTLQLYLASHTFLTL